MGVGGANSRLCGMKVAGFKVEVASDRGGGLAIDRFITPRSASANDLPESRTCRRIDRARDIDIRFAISTA
jgi:hypothetical protein